MHDAHARTQATAGSLILVACVSCPACERTRVGKPVESETEPTCMALVRDDPYVHQRLDLCVTEFEIEVEYERSPKPWLSNVIDPELERQNRWQLDELHRPALRWLGRIEDPAWARDWLSLAQLPLEPRPANDRGLMITIAGEESVRTGAPASEQRDECRWRVDEIDRLARVELGMPMGEGPIRVASVGEREVEIFVASYDPHTRLVTLDAFVDLRLTCHMTLTLTESEELRRKVLAEREWDAMRGWADFLGEPGDYVDPGVAGWPGVPLSAAECERRLSRDPCERAQGSRRELLAGLRDLTRRCRHQPA